MEVAPLPRDSMSGRNGTRISAAGADSKPAAGAEIRDSSTSRIPLPDGENEAVDQAAPEVWWEWSCDRP